MVLPVTAGQPRTRGGIVVRVTAGPDGTGTCDAVIMSCSAGRGQARAAVGLERLGEKASFGEVAGGHARRGVEEGLAGPGVGAEKGGVPVHGGQERRAVPGSHADITVF